MKNTTTISIDLAKNVFQVAVPTLLRGNDMKIA